MDSKKEIQHVYLVGAKSLGAYGGYETFVYKLTEYHQNKENIKYHVACKANGDGCMDETKFDGVTKINDHEFEFHNAHCFKIDVPQIGPAQAIYYDVAALKACCEHIKENHIPHPIVYIMACRIGPFAGHFYREIHKLGGTVFLNPDGHEWMRAKWSAPIRKYWKISEQMMVKYCDLTICDSVNIEKYIHECYDGKGIKGSSPKTTFIAYGADLTLSKLADDDEKLVSWYKEKGLTKKGYYLVVGRFVPENSFEVMIREFMKSKSKKDFAIITNVNEKFLNSPKRGIVSFVISLVITYMCQCYFMTERFVTENFVMRHSFLYCLPYFLIGGIVYLYKDEIERFVNQFKVISFCVVLALTVGYYITPDVINSINIVVIKTLILYTGWLGLALGYDNRLMNNKFTNYISNLSMEMYLSHMVVFRIVEKIGIMERIESPVIRYMTTYLLLVMLLVMGLTIYRKAINKLDELR